MVDGIVDIPLEGRTLAPNGADDATVCHFIAGPENRLVEVAVRAVVEHPDLGFNPLVLYGPSGTGKSHIAGGLAAACKNQNRRARVVCVTAVDFARELADAIESQAIEEFRTKYRRADLLVFEDLGPLAVHKKEKLSAQEELVHTLDALVAAGRWAIVTVHAAPAELPDLLPSLRSRLAAGLTIPLAPPGAEARRRILRQLALLRGVGLPDAAANLLADELEVPAPELAGALESLTASLRWDAAEVDLPGVRRFLAIRNQKQQPTLHEIALATARHFSIRLSELRSSDRRRALVAARGVAAYLARHGAGESLQEIGRYFGGRDHATVLHSCRKTAERSKTDPQIHEAIEHLQKELWKT
ncbi:MAG: DnaA/Hda family protein [Thermoguttaceae bacterium]